MSIEKELIELLKRNDCLLKSVFTADENEVRQMRLMNNGLLEKALNQPTPNTSGRGNNEKKHSYGTIG